MSYVGLILDHSYSHEFVSFVPSLHRNEFAIVNFILPTISQGTRMPQNCVVWARNIVYQQANFHHN